jgi:hypothetical protein
MASYIRIMWAGDLMTMTRGYLLIEAGGISISSMTTKFVGGYWGKSGWAKAGY